MNNVDKIFNNSSGVSDYSKSYLEYLNLVLTSICYNPHGDGGWWCGYGWEKVYCL